MTEQEQLNILTKHMIQSLGKEKTQSYISQSVKHLFTYHGLAWNYCKIDFTCFCELFLYDFLFDYSSGRVPLSALHLDIWREIQDVILNKNGTRNNYVFPRSFGKTSVISTPLILWATLYGHSNYTVVIGATERITETFIEAIKTMIEDNDLIKSCFGEIMSKGLINNKLELELDTKPNRVKIQGFASTSAIRGVKYRNHRINLLVVDDGQTEDQIQTEKSREDFVQRFNDGALKAVEQGKHNVFAFGTVQYEGDLYDSFYKSPAWRTRREKCILLDDIDEYFRHDNDWQKVKEILKTGHKDINATYKAADYYEKHKEDMQYPVIWENYDRYSLALSYFSNPVSFKKEYQSDITALGEKRIKSLSAIPENEIESLEFSKTVLSIDPAATTNKKSDYSAFCVLSENEDNKLRYARKMIIAKLDFDDYINKIIDLLLAYTDIKVLSIEKQVYMGADVLKVREKIAENPELKSRSIQIINKSRTRNKENRIEAIVGDINSGRVIFNESDTEAIEQIKTYAGVNYTQHDDMIDALADSLENIAIMENNISFKILDLRKYGL